MNNKERICPYCGSNEIETDNIAYFVEDTAVIECYCRSCNEFFDETHKIDSQEIIDGAFQWCCVELDAKIKVEHSKGLAYKLANVKKHADIVKSVGYEAFRQWEDIIMHSFIEGMYYPKDVEEGFNKEKYIESRIYGEALKYVIDMMRDFIKETSFMNLSKEETGEFLYNDTPIQY
jgi:hypothetical protein